jgi:two-component system KDP operon response regulator KdpE
MPEPATILVVDDEVAICRSLEAVLAQDGHAVVAVQSGEAALAQIDGQDFDLALLDLQLKSMSGMDVVAYLRQHSPDTAIIILTAHGSLETAVEALRQGAHDYLFKPCKTTDLRESVRRGLLKRHTEKQRRILLAQLESSLLQGLQGLRATIESHPADSAPTPAPTDSSQNLQRGRLAVDLAQHTVTLNGQPVELSPTEFDLLAYLAAQAPRVISAQELIRQVQGYDIQPDEAREIVRYHVYRIRQKAQAAAGVPDLIRTVRGIGYTIGG